MKRISILALLAVLVGCAFAVMPGGIIVEAQSLPITKTLEWTPNSPTEQVESYVVTYDGAALPQVLATTCTTTCSAPFTITAEGKHTLTVKAVNLWGESAVSPLEIDVKVPGNPNGVKVRKP